MFVCPKCGSSHVSEMGYSGSGFSGISGYSGMSGAQGISGFSAVGHSGMSGQPPSGPPPVMQFVGQTPNYGASGVKIPQPAPYPKMFSCSNCGWAGKENELIDDFKFAIRNALAISGVEMPVPQIVNKTVTDEAPPPLNETVTDANIKSVLGKLVDKVLGEKRKE